MKDYAYKGNMWKDNSELATVEDVRRIVAEQSTKQAAKRLVSRVFNFVTGKDGK